MDVNTAKPADAAPAAPAIDPAEEAFMRDVIDAANNNKPIDHILKGLGLETAGADAPAKPAPAAADDTEEVADIEDDTETKPAVKKDRHPLEAFADGEEAADENIEVAVPKAAIDWAAKQKIDLLSVLNEHPKLSEEVATLRTRAAEMEADIAALDRLSPDLQSLIVMDLEGKDWRKERSSRPDLNMNLTFEKQDPKAVLDFYAKGKVTEDQLKEYLDPDGDQRDKAIVEARLDAAKLLYDADRTKAVDYAKTKRAQDEEIMQRRTASREASIAHVIKTVPGAASRKDEITASLDDLSQFFYEKDGVTYKADAALNAWVLKNRDLILKTMSKRATQAAEESATVNLMRRTDAKKASTAQRNGSGASAVPESPEQRVARILKENRV